MRPPRYKLVYKFYKPPVTIVINTINHSDIGVMFTNLAILGASHCMTIAIWGVHTIVKQAHVQKKEAPKSGLTCGGSM